MPNIDTCWAIPEDNLKESFEYIKKILQERDKTVFVDWSRATLDEVTPNVTRTLTQKYSGCTHGFSATKIAGLYAFWISKLKPGFTIIRDFRYLNEYAGILTGMAIIKERLHIDIVLKKEEVLEICNTLRYHTSSPHTMMHIFALWVDREKLRQQVKPS